METNTLNDINDNVNINGVNYGESAAPEQQGEEIRTPAPSEQNGETTAQPADVQNMSDKKFDEYINSIMSGDEPHKSEEEEAVSTASDEEQGADDDEQSHSDDSLESDLNSEKPFKTFQSAEEYQSEIDRIFSKRFHDYKRTKADHADLLENLCDIYGVQTPFEAANMLRNKAENIRRTAAPSRRVQSVPQGLYPEADKPESPEKHYVRMFNQLDSLQQFDPNFSANEVYANDPQFKSILHRTNSPYIAYADYIKRTVRSNATEQKATQSMQQKALKNDFPGESRKIRERTFKEGAATLPSSAGRVETDASRLSDEEFEKYIKKIENEF